jgi:acyl-CoA thioester hydrolase
MDTNKIHSVPIDVRFRDLDALGHVNNAVYFTYFEEGRKSLFQKLYKGAGPYDFRFILAHVSCDYITPAKLNDALILYMVVGEIGNKSFEFKYDLTDRIDKSKIFARGESVQVCFNYTRNRSIPVSDTLKQKLIEYQRK